MEQVDAYDQLTRRVSGADNLMNGPSASTRVSTADIQGTAAASIMHHGCIMRAGKAARCAVRREASSAGATWLPKYHHLDMVGLEESTSVIWPEGSIMDGQGEGRAVECPGKEHRRSRNYVGEHVVRDSARSAGPAKKKSAGNKNGGRPPRRGQPGQRYRAPRKKVEETTPRRPWRRRRISFQTMGILCL